VLAGGHAPVVIHRPAKAKPAGECLGWSAFFRQFIVASRARTRPGVLRYSA
jgi:hypothetical protein